MKPEQKLWHDIRKFMPGCCERIENLVNDGTPDVSGSWSGVDYWIELKVCSNKKKLRDPAELCRPSQKVWHYRRIKEGARIFVIVKYVFAVALYRCVGYKEYTQLLSVPPSYHGLVLQDALKKALTR
jgi:hypothetical protein